MISMQMDFVALSSSRGTTLEAVFQAIDSGNLQARCIGLITDKDDRGCIQKAIDHNIPVEVVPRQKGIEREQYDKKIDETIIDLGGGPDVIVACIGWMFIISPWFVHQYQNRILNVHPSLIPKFPGAHAIDDALEAGESETGMTIHLIDEGVDTGPIITQQSCLIYEGDTVEDVKHRVQELEKKWYPYVLQKIHTKQIKLTAS